MRIKCAFYTLFREGYIPATHFSLVFVHDRIQSNKRPVVGSKIFHGSQNVFQYVGSKIFHGSQNVFQYFFLLSVYFGCYLIL